MRRPRTTSIRRGTRLYHGTSAEEDFELPSPAWFSDSPGPAREFQRWHEGTRPRTLEFVVRKTIPRLVLIEDNPAMNLFALWLEDRSGISHRGDVQSMAEATCDAGYSGWHIPDNYVDGSDTLICEPEVWLEPANGRRQAAEERTSSRDVRREKTYTPRLRAQLASYARRAKAGGASPKWSEIYEAIERGDLEVFEFLKGKAVA
jgi:hypothetical protein